MNGRFPITITPEQVNLFMEKCEPLVGLGLLLFSVKIIQKIPPEITEAPLGSLDTATESRNQESSSRANKLLEDSYTEPMNLSTPQSASLAIDIQLVEKQQWQKLIPHPCVVIILGRKGRGKSGLGYRVLELFPDKVTPYVLGIPAQAQRMLPDMIGVAENLDDIPLNSVVLVDEAYLTYHSRDSLKAQSMEMSRIVNLSRQRSQTLIFVTPEARQLDKNITSQADVIIFKEPGMLQMKFDRPELNDIVRQAKQAFTNVKGDKRKWAYVYSPDADFMGLVENSLPTFWSTRLSRAFANSKPTSGKRPAKMVDKEDKIAEAKKLYQSIPSYRKVGNILGVAPGTVYNWVNDYPYNK